MNFLVDAQLPRKLAVWLTDEGHDARHTLDLPAANRSTDAVIIATADAEQRIVVTKDADFVDSHVVNGRPARLLLVSTGNIRNADLLALLVRNISTLQHAFANHAFVEIGPSGVILRG